MYFLLIPLFQLIIIETLLILSVFSNSVYTHWVRSGTAIGYNQLAQRTGYGGSFHAANQLAAGISACLHDRMAATI